MALAKRWIRSHGPVVLTFHRVLSKEAAAKTCSPAGILVNEATFESLLQYIRERHSVIDLAKECSFAADGKIKMAITFDDGWEDNASVAYPIAAEQGVPFTIFVCPDLIDKSMPFWPESIVALIRAVDASSQLMNRACRTFISKGYPQWAAILTNPGADRAASLIEGIKSLSEEKRERLLHSLEQCGVLSGQRVDRGVDRTMSWDQLEHLHEAGVSFGSHTMRHKILTRIPTREVEREVRESKADLEARLELCRLFSYPNGDSSAEVRALVGRCGYELAFINSPGVWRKNSDPMRIPRINLCEETLTGPDGRFSPSAFEYRVFWTAFTKRG